MSKASHKITDPVCGMNVKPKNVSARSKYEGKTYYFCSQSCKDQFDQSPKRYIEKKVA